MAFVNWTAISSYVSSLVSAAGVIPVVESPTGAGVNLQGNADGHAYVAVQSAALPTGAASETTLGSLLARAALLASEAGLSLVQDAVDMMRPSSVYREYAVGGAIGSDADLRADSGSNADCRQIIVGTPGTLVLIRPDDTSVTLSAALLTASPVIEVRAKRIRSTSTAQNIMVMW